MNIKNQLLIEHSKANTKLIVKYIGEDKARIADLMSCFFSNTYRVTQRSAMVVSHLFDVKPHLMLTYQKQMILNLQQPDIDVAIKRNSLRILQFQEIPDGLASDVFDICFNFVESKKEPVAVKAFSMNILLNSCKNYPELKSEVIPLVEMELNNTNSKGILSRGKKVLAQLYRLD